MKQSPLVLPSLNYFTPPAFSHPTNHAPLLPQSTRLHDPSPTCSGGHESLHHGNSRRPDLYSPTDVAPTTPPYAIYGYTRILPRTNSASELFTKQCETCGSSHDGSFGAGRFCSSRCARTVGGLAHRRKRMLERGMKARCAAENREKAKKNAAIAREFIDTWRRKSMDVVEVPGTTHCTGRGLSRIPAVGQLLTQKPSSPESPRAMMRIGSLLNPAEQCAGS